MKKTLLFPIMLLIFTSLSIAQERPIDEMFRVMGIEKQMVGGFEAMLPLIDQMAARFSLDTQGKEELKEIFRKWFEEDIDRKKLAHDFKGIYLESFSDSEIREITKFYKTPVGQKFLEKTPALMKAGAQLGMQEGQFKQAQLMERVKPLLKKYGIQ